VQSPVKHGNAGGIGRLRCESSAKQSKIPTWPARRNSVNIKANVAEAIIKAYIGEAVRDISVNEKSINIKAYVIEALVKTYIGEALVKAHDNFVNEYSVNIKAYFAEAIIKAYIGKAV